MHLIRDEKEWLAQQFELLTSEVIEITPSGWAEEKRYLPPQVTSLPGYYRFQVTPYLEEILNSLSFDSPVREVAVMKGVQLGLTVGVLENAIGYYIDHVRTAPIMLVTADAELAKLRLDGYVVPMIQFSGLEHLIKSHDEIGQRKQGKTDKKIEWEGGGFLVPFGAQNANKMRSLSIQVLLRDEIDGWPLTVGKDGDPIKLTEDRTAAYEGSRKILDISTPGIKGVSKIERRFLLGDQRYYFIRCLKCAFPQRLAWKRTDEKTGEVTGITWETEQGRLVAESVRYLCKNCSHGHINDDKTRLLSPEHGAEWTPTAQAISPEYRSYHLNSLYSPVGMRTWQSIVADWLQVWDVEKNQARDLGLMQVFYNNNLAQSWEVVGERVSFATVSPHRRRQYNLGEIPNYFAQEYCGSPVLLLTCAVDVQKDNLAVGVFGWCRDRRAVLIDYWRFEGDTQQLDNKETWGRLQDLIENKTYIADDGKQYKIQVTLVDSGYLTDQVYRFCGEYQAGVFPVKGRELPPKHANIKEFSEFTTPSGTIAYGITVDLYKDRWSAALRRSWDGQSVQPAGHFNAPTNISDKALKELTVETKREKLDKTTKKSLGFEWHRPQGAANELWDILGYNNACLDIIAFDVCRRQLGLEFVNWTAFYDMAAGDRLFFTEGASA